jgi:hypothetical protein
MIKFTPVKTYHYPMKIYLAILISSVFFIPLAGQNLGAYTDYKNYFFAFDGGPNIELESQPVKSYKVGGNAVAYINSADNFRAYYKGEIYDLLSISPLDYQVTDNYVLFNRDMILSVFDNGKQTRLSGYCNSYAAGDSIIAFFDLNSSILKVYTNGQIQELDNLLGKEADSIKFKVGDNVVAYINTADQFKIFYREHILNLESNAPASFQAGRNIVSYIDGYTQSFKIFYNGMSYTVESTPPLSYVTADDMVAYVSSTGDFKIFYQGQLLKASSFAPTFYEARDRVIVFFDGKFFTAFYNGKITTLETYVPTYQLDYNTVAYIDRSNYLQALYNGKQQRISEEKINSFELTGDVLKYNAGLSDVKFFLKGKIVLH